MSLSHLPEMRSLVERVEGAAADVRESTRRTKHIVVVQVACVSIQVAALVIFDVVVR